MAFSVPRRRRGGWRRQQPPRVREGKREGEREECGPINIHIARALGFRYFRGHHRARVSAPGGLWISTNFLLIFVWRERFNRPGAWVQSVILNALFVLSRISSSALSLFLSLLVRLLRLCHHPAEKRPRIIRRFSCVSLRRDAFVLRDCRSMGLEISLYTRWNVNSFFADLIALLIMLSLESFIYRTVGAKLVKRNDET